MKTRSYFEKGGGFWGGGGGAGVHLTVLRGYGWLVQGGWPRKMQGSVLPQLSG